MNFKFTEEQIALQTKCELFAKEEISPHVKRLEEDLEFRKNLFKKMAQAGLLLLSVSEDRGGAFFSGTIGYSLGLKAIAQADAGISVAMSITNMVAETISIFGTKEQWAKYLPNIANGNCVPLSFALTEKKAGSDAKNISTEAKLDSDNPDYYVINGEKQFITNADLAGAIILLAKISGIKDSHGITAFLVDENTPGLSITKKENKLGLLTASLTTVTLTNCRIHKKQILGQIGQGFKIALSSLDSGRIGIAAQALGIAEAAFEAALRFSKSREQFGHKICENQVIAFKLADMQVKLSASKLLLFKAAWMKDQNMPFTLEASEAKLFCSEAANEVTTEALQIFGGYGYIKDYPVEKYFRDARVTTLYEGTSEIQRIVISRNVLMNNED
jgi:acyl-CoA dehydrogenase